MSSRQEVVNTGVDDVPKTKGKRTRVAKATPQKTKRKHPDECYEMRSRMSKEEADAIRQELQELNNQVKAKKKKLRAAKERKLLKPEVLKAVRQQSAQRLAPYRYQKKAEV